MNTVKLFYQKHHKEPHDQYANVTVRPVVFREKNDIKLWRNRLVVDTTAMLLLLVFLLHLLSVTSLINTCQQKVPNVRGH